MNEDPMEPQRTSGSTFFLGRCLQCSEDLVPPGPDLQTVNSYDLTCSHEILRHFPQEPWWWREEDADEHRAQMSADFEPSDIGFLVDEISIYFDPLSPPTTVSDIASLVRRQLSLHWKVEVAKAWLPSIGDNYLDYAYRKVEIDNASNLAALVWRFVMDLPPMLLNDAVRAAAARPFEIEPNDD